MKRTYRRWTCGLVAAVAVLLAACAAVVYLVDPCLYYRMPEDWDPIFFNERYQAAGLAKNVQADTVLMGTSMAANYRASQIADTSSAPRRSGSPSPTAISANSTRSWRCCSAARTRSG